MSQSVTYEGFWSFTMLHKFSYKNCLCIYSGPVKGLEERHELGITWNKYIEQKYKYSIGKRVLNVSLTAKVLGWS